MSALAYCTPLSVVAGSPVAVHATGSGEATVVRDGADPVVVRRFDVDVPDLPLPRDSPEQGCDWPVAAEIDTTDLRGGMYVVHIGDAPPSAWFVVRASTPGAPLLKLSTNTWNAYNDVGGRNLYTGAVRLSFERPLAAGFLTKPAERGGRVVDGRDFVTHYRRHGLSMWHGMAGWAGQERRFVAWCEQRGVAVDLCVDSDLHDATALDGRRLLLSVGHDEYWTQQMRDAVDAHIAAGAHVAFLSGNTCYWQVRVEHHVMVGWKHRFAEDPEFPSDSTTTMWADPLLGRPEAALTGVSFTRGGYHRIHRSSPRGAGRYEVHRPQHWLLDGTALERGDLFGDVGYECDGCELVLVDGVPTAAGTYGTPATFDVVATAPATPFDASTTPLPLPEGGEFELVFHARRLLGDDSPAAQDRLRAGHAVLGSWTAASGGTVVTTGCTEWAYGLGDPVVDRVTHNVLGRLGGSRPHMGCRSGSSS